MVFQVTENRAFGKPLSEWRYAEVPFSVFMCRHENCGFFGLSPLFCRLLIGQHGRPVAVISPPVALACARQPALMPNIYIYFLNQRRKKKCAFYKYPWMCRLGLKPTKYSISNYINQPQRSSHLGCCCNFIDIAHNHSHIAAVGFIICTVNILCP